MIQKVILVGVRCNRCNEYIDIKQVDEFTPPDQKKGIEITPQILDGDNAHIWRQKNGNLYIHYPENESKKTLKSGRGEEK